MRPLGSTDLKRLHRQWRHRTSGRVALVLDEVHGPFNVGSIIRTAAAYRVDRIWLTGGTPDPASEKVGKTAMGTGRYVEFERVESGVQAIDAARAQGYLTVGLELAHEAVPLHELDLAPDVCLVVGHEDRGLSPATMEACDALAFLPQLGRVGSLNVATATAVGIYELRRRAWSDPQPRG
jgi:tRNA (guanosine-2'-O-)-methyltransferase